MLPCWFFLFQFVSSSLVILVATREGIEWGENRDGCEKVDGKGDKGGEIRKKTKEMEEKTWRVVQEGEVWI